MTHKLQTFPCLHSFHRPVRRGNKPGRRSSSNAISLKNQHFFHSMCSHTLHKLNEQHFCMFRPNMSSGTPTLPPQDTFPPFLSYQETCGQRGFRWKSGKVASIVFPHFFSLLATANANMRPPSPKR